MRRRRSSGETWLNRALPSWSEYRLVLPGSRQAFTKRMAVELGLSENTSRRMLTAVGYLSERGADLDGLAADPPALNAIEAVARIGRLDPDRERSALDLLLRNGAPVRYFLALAADAEAADASRTRAEPRTGRTTTLESLVHEIAPNSPPSAIRLQSPSAFGPVAVVETGTRTLAVFAFGIDHFLVASTNFQTLVDRAVLRGLAAHDRVVVCRGVTLTDLDESRRRMRPEWKERLDVRDVLLSDLGGELRPAADDEAGRITGSPPTPTKSHQPPTRRPRRPT